MGLNTHLCIKYSVHVIVDQLIDYQTQKKIQLRDPLHFMDMEALTPKSDLSPEVTLACKFQGWVYMALIAKKVRCITVKHAYDVYTFNKFILIVK